MIVSLRGCAIMCSLLVCWFKQNHQKLPTQYPYILVEKCSMCQGRITSTLDPIWLMGQLEWIWIILSWTLWDMTWVKGLGPFEVTEYWFLHTKTCIWLPSYIKYIISATFFFYTFTSWPTCFDQPIDVLSLFFILYTVTITVTPFSIMHPTTETNTQMLLDELPHQKPSLGKHVVYVDSHHAHTWEEEHGFSNDKKSIIVFSVLFWTWYFLHF